MTTDKTCPNCGRALAAEALMGLCPACLLKAGMATGSGTVGGAASARFVPPMPEELARFFPQLEILTLIGRGGMGAVYKVRQRRLDRLAALKILPPGIGHDPAFAARFEREAKALAKLHHQNIVTLYEYGQADGLFYFLMEFVDGVNLRQLMNAGHIKPKEALAIVPQICEALQFAHDRNVVHRDIKPENILLTKDGQVKIADFGVAKIIQGRGASPRRPSDEGRTAGPFGMAQGKPAVPTELTEAGRVIGTPQYMAPEQTAHPSEVDHRADIYSLGVVFYQMLTGELPVGKDLEPPSKRVTIDVRLDAVVLRALEKEPERRYQRVDEVRTMVETIVATPPSTEPVRKTPASARESLKDGKPEAQWEGRAPGWRIRCRTCGFTEHFGKYGIRMAAAGRKWTLGRCERCGRVRVHVIEKGPAQASQEVPPAPAGPPRPAMRSSWLLVLVVAAIVMFVVIPSVALFLAIALPYWSRSVQPRQTMGLVQNTNAATTAPEADGASASAGDPPPSLTDAAAVSTAPLQGASASGAPALSSPADQEMAGSAPRLQFRLVADERETSRWEWLPDPRDKTGRQWLRVRKEAVLDESAVVSASVTNSPTGDVRITLRFSDGGSKRFAEVTAANIRRKLAIVFDGRVLAAPSIMEPTTGGMAEISGTFSRTEAAAICDALNRSADVPAAVVEEPEAPKLRFLAWQDENVEHDSTGWHAWHPDGTRVEDKDELKWISHARPTWVDVKLTIEGRKNPRFLFLWFSHPTLENNSFAKVTLYDGAGQDLALNAMAGGKSATMSTGQRVMRADASTGDPGWILHTVSPGYFANMPSTISVRLEYGIGPWTVGDAIAPGYSGSMSLGNHAMLGPIGQSSEGHACISVTRSDAAAPDTQYGFLALTKDGRAVEHTWFHTSGFTNLLTETSEFPVRLDEVRVFQLRTRPVRSIEFKNVPLLRSAKAPEAHSVGLSRELVFGPVIMRSLSEQNTKRAKSMIDLETGASFKPPRQMGIHDTWLGQNGIDMVTEAKAGIQGLVGLDMRVVEIDRNQWYTLSATDVAGRLVGAEPAPETAMRTRPDVPTAFLFQTRAGAMGMMQAAGYPDGVEIRYRLLYPSGTPGAANREADNGLAIERTTVAVNSAVIKGRARMKDQIMVFAGDRKDGWSCGLPEDTRFTVTLVEDRSELQCRIMGPLDTERQAVDTRRIGTVRLDQGHLVFRAGRPAVEPDGAVIVADWVPASGKALPVGVILLAGDSTQPTDPVGSGEMRSADYLKPLP